MLLRSGLYCALLLTAARLFAGPNWTTNPAALGNADLEGRLALALPMGPAAGSAPEFGLELQLVHTTEEVKLKASARDARIDLVRKAAGLPKLDRPPRVKGPDGQPAEDPQVTMYRSRWNMSTGSHIDSGQDSS